MTDRTGVDTGGFGDGGSRRSFGKGCLIAAGIGCIALIVLLATCVGGGAWFLKKTSSAATDEFRALLDDVRHERHDDAYARVSETWRDSATPETFRRQLEALRPLLGDDLDLSVRGIRIEAGDDGYREVTYLATWTGGEATVLVRLDKDARGAERVSGVQVDRRQSPGDPGNPASAPDATAHDHDGETP